ncbi:MAG: sigma-70 family RNA polymerase sigma factor [Planctomycetota bacterium]
MSTTRQDPQEAAFEYDAVITHAASDAEAVRALVRELENDGRRIGRFDEHEAREAPDTVRSGVGASRRVLGYLSPDYCESWWCGEGAPLLSALDERWRLVPVIADGFDTGDLPAWFRARPGLPLDRPSDGGFEPSQLSAVLAVVGSDRPSDQSTVVMLHRWFDGDSEAIEQLLGENLAWMQGYVRKHLNPGLRRRFDSMDVVQDGALRILRYNPRHPPANRAQLRALFKKALLDTLRDKIDHIRAGRRSIDREESMAGAVGSDLQPLGRSAEEAPDAAAEKQELREWVKLALQFLDPVDREVILGREYRREPFEVIADELGIASADAARMRYNRALPRLALKIRELRRHETDSRREAADAELDGLDLDSR